MRDGPRAIQLLAAGMRRPRWRKRRIAILMIGSAVAGAFLSGRGADATPDTPDVGIDQGRQGRRHDNKLIQAILLSRC
jgi:hypothetical protein